MTQEIRYQINGKDNPCRHSPVKRSRDKSGGDDGTSLTDTGAYAALYGSRIRQLITK